MVFIRELKLIPFISLLKKMLKHKSCSQQIEICSQWEVGRLTTKRLHNVFVEFRGQNEGKIGIFGCDTFFD